MTSYKPIKTAKEKKIEQLEERWDKTIGHFKRSAEELETWSYPTRWSDGIWEEEIELIKFQIQTLINIRKETQETQNEPSE